MARAEKIKMASVADCLYSGYNDANRRRADTVVQTSWSGRAHSIKVRKVNADEKHKQVIGSGMLTFPYQGGVKLHIRNFTKDIQKDGKCILSIRSWEICCKLREANVTIYTRSRLHCRSARDLAARHEGRTIKIRPFFNSDSSPAASAALSA